MSIEFVNIPVPLPSVQPRGFNNDNPDFVPTAVKTFRITQEDYETIMEAAAITGTTCSEFIRWCSLFASTDIVRQHRKRKL